MINKDYDKFRSKVASRLVKSEAALALFLKKNSVESVIYDPNDSINQIFFSLVTNPDLYALFKIAVEITDNKKGDELYNKNMKNYEQNKNK